VALARALDAEHQLRPLDAVIGFDAGARAVLRVVPGVGRTARVLGDDLSPGQVVERALAARGEKTA
jgi:hypothetical protein